VNTILVDHDIEGQILMLWGRLAAEGWLALCPLQLVTFVQVGLPVASNDRTVWRFAQAQAMILLTHNRNMRDADSLEQTLREENMPKRGASTERRDGHGNFVHQRSLRKRAHEPEADWLLHCH
jgi:hypothetical protein